MKKLYSQLAGILACAFIFTACTKDEEAQKTTFIIGSNSEEGIYKANDIGVSFVPSNLGLEGQSRYIQCFLDNGSEILLGTKQGIYRSKDNGISWRLYEGGLTGRALSVVALLTKDNKVYAGTSEGGIYTYIQAVNSWKPMNDGLEGNGLFVKTMLKFNDKIFIGTLDGVYKWDDSTKRWEPLNNGLGGEESKAVIGMASIGEELYIATAGGGVKKSSDGGLNWIYISKTLLDKTVNAICSIDSKLYIGCNKKGIYCYENKSWQEVSINLPEESKKIRSMTYKKGVLLIGTIGGGSYYSLDKGLNWQATQGTPINTEIMGVLIR